MSWRLHGIYVVVYLYALVYTCIVYAILVYFVLCVVYLINFLFIVRLHPMFSFLPTLFPLPTFFRSRGKGHRAERPTLRCAAAGRARENRQVGRPTLGLVRGKGRANPPSTGGLP